MSSPLPESEDSPVISEKNWTLRYDDCTTSEYGSPDSSITDTTWTAEAETTNSDSNEWVLLDEDERKTAETPQDRRDGQR